MFGLENEYKCICDKQIAAKMFLKLSWPLKKIPKFFQVNIEFFQKYQCWKLLNWVCCSVSHLFFQQSHFNTGYSNCNNTAWRKTQFIQYRNLVRLKMNKLNLDFIVCNNVHSISYKFAMPLHNLWKDVKDCINTH